VRYGKKVNRVSQYVRYINEVNWDGLKFPVSLHSRMFERSNSTSSINVYFHQEETDDVIPVYLTKYSLCTNHIDLLLLKKK
jgi:hypothetical protein